MRAAHGVRIANRPGPPAFAPVILLGIAQFRSHSSPVEGNQRDPDEQGHRSHHQSSPTRGSQEPQARLVRLH